MKGARMELEDWSDRPPLYPVGLDTKVSGARMEQ